MSRTELKNGQLVERAIREVAYGKSPLWYGMFYVGEVAKAARVSRPTVLKYIEALKKFGTVEELERDMRYCSKTTPRTFVYTGAKSDG